MKAAPDPRASFDAAIAAREANYAELRQAVAALLYVRNKLQADGASESELRAVHAEVTEAMQNLARRYAEIQAVRREKLRAVAIMSAAEAQRRLLASGDEAGLESAREYIDQLAAEQALERDLNS